jgi:SAM-dependent methyltransferase
MGWNHNSHYHRVVLEAVPPGAERALDVGCGQGELCRKLRAVVPRVAGMDRDERSLDLARGKSGDVSYVLADFAATPLEPGSFDVICSVAVLHHMNTKAALTRMAGLLRPGGVLVIIGLATDAMPRSLIWEIPAAIGHRARWIAGYRQRAAGDYQSPVVWPPPHSYREIRELSAEVLPGSRFRRRLYWRYSLTWVKP